MKLSLQPYLFDFWNKKVKIAFGESYDKVLIDYELINLALGHFWNNATKYVSHGSEITISFSPSGKDTYSKDGLAACLTAFSKAGTNNVRMSKYFLNSFLVTEVS